MKNETHFEGGDWIPTLTIRDMQPLTDAFNSLSGTIAEFRINILSMLYYANYIDGTKYNEKELLDKLDCMKLLEQLLEWDLPQHQKHISSYDMIPFYNELFAWYGKDTLNKRYAPFIDLIPLDDQGGSYAPYNMERDKRDFQLIDNALEAIKAVMKLS